MSNEQVNKVNSADVTPESLMEYFHGPGLVKMLLVTVIFHAVLILGTSVSYLKTSVLGEDVSKLTKEQRVEKAVADATTSLRKIAAANGVNPQDISDKMGGGAARAVKKEAVAPVGQPSTDATNKVAPAKVNSEVATPPATTGETPARPESQIEKDLKKTVDGPKAPPATVTDDIF
jgi:hypothetical protein